MNTRRDPVGGWPHLGDMDAEAAVDARAVEAHEDPEVHGRPARPQRVAVHAVSAKKMILLDMPMKLRNP